MKAQELKLEKKGYTMSVNTYPARSHYKSLMTMGKVLPSTKAQAKFFLSYGVCMDVLNFDDVQIIESLLNKHGFEGDYKFTKSKSWVRLQNNNDLHEAIKKEFL